MASFCHSGSWYIYYGFGLLAWQNIWSLSWLWYADSEWLCFVNLYLVLYEKLHQTQPKLFLPLMLWCLSEAFVRRSLFNAKFCTGMPFHSRPVPVTFLPFPSHSCKCRSRSISMSVIHDPVPFLQMSFSFHFYECHSRSRPIPASYFLYVNRPALFSDTQNQQL